MQFFVYVFALSKSSLHPPIMQGSCLAQGWSDNTTHHRPTHEASAYSTGHLAGQVYKYKGLFTYDVSHQGGGHSPLILLQMHTRITIHAQTAV